LELHAILKRIIAKNIVHLNKNKKEELVIILLKGTNLLITFQIVRGNKLKVCKKLMAKVVATAVLEVTNNF
jgi:hypothetical protein